MYIRSALFKRNLRFRVNYKGVEGNPDIYFTKARVAVFVNGCYWHRHDGCKYAYIPKSNTDFWLAKFETNVRRDGIVYKILEEHGVRVLVVWECTVKKMKSDAGLHGDVISQIEDFIFTGSTMFVEV